jgi:CheY-like chemotaxis protein
MAVAIALFMSLVFVVLATAHEIAGSHREAIANLVLAALMIAGPMVLRATGRYGLVINGTLAVTFAVIVFIGGSERGAGINAATVALAEIPLFATLLAGPRVGAIWLVLACGAGIALGFAGQAHLVESRLPADMKLFDDHVVLLIVTATLYSVAALYERGRAQGLAHIAALEAEQRATEIEKLAAQAEARVAQAERMAALGRVASAAAHEINNPLSYVANNLEYLRRQPELAADPESANAIAEALDGAQRIEKIVSELKAYAPPSDHPQAALDVQNVLKSALELADLRAPPPPEGLLPREDPAPRAEHMKTPPLPTSAGERRARILVVDDEPLVARAIQRLLRDHEVVIVGSGRDALRLLADERRFDLVLCDMMMPDLGGMDVYVALEQSRPELLPRLVFMTGATFTDRAREFQARISNVFLDKPVQIERVLELLAEQRGSRSTSAAE